MRWRAVVTYRTETGPLDVEHFVEEIDELQDLIERGPNWNTVERIVVTLARKSAPGLTVEKAEVL